ncbi:MAG: RNA polymerase sigma factor [Saprospiraceae bacterium]|nr:RNA polymerase sigma factor [Saprospiraceae bacterium]
MEVLMLTNWVRSACNGDQQAWNSLYRSCHANLLSKAFRICGNTQTAKDSVQDAFLLAYLNLNKLKEPRTFYGWIERICINCCYRAVRTNRHLPIAGIPLENEVWWEDELEKKFDEISKHVEIFDGLANLSDTLRSTLLLRYFTRYNSYDDISLILGIPAGTVRSRLNQAKQKMSEYWQLDKFIDDRYVKDAEEWNSFYLETLMKVHNSLDSRSRFINHLNKDILYFFTSGKTQVGRIIIEKEIEDDLLHGTGFGDANIISSGDMTVVEIKNINSEEYPYRCPDSTVIVFHRVKGSVVKINLHNSSMDTEAEIQV